MTSVGNNGTVKVYMHWAVFHNSECLFSCSIEHVLIKPHDRCRLLLAKQAMGGRIHRFGYIGQCPTRFCFQNMHVYWDSVTVCSIEWLMCTVGLMLRLAEQMMGLVIKDSAQCVSN